MITQTKHCTRSYTDQLEQRLTLALVRASFGDPRRYQQLLSQLGIIVEHHLDSSQQEQEHELEEPITFLSVDHVTQVTCQAINDVGGYVICDEERGMGYRIGIPASGIIKRGGGKHLVLYLTNFYRLAIGTLYEDQPEAAYEACYII